MTNRTGAAACMTTAENTHGLTDSVRGCKRLGCKDLQRHCASFVLDITGISSGTTNGNQADGKRG